MTIGSLFDSAPTAVNCEKCSHALSWHADGICEYPGCLTCGGRLVAPGTIARYDREFAEFHAKNPEVYAGLVRLARQAAARGREKIGIGMLFEVLRWEFWMVTDDPHSDWKLNNNYRSRFSRLIMEQEPDLAEIFEIRSLRENEG